MLNLKISEISPPDIEIIVGATESELITYRKSQKNQHPDEMVGAPNCKAFHRFWV